MKKHLIISILSVLLGVAAAHAETYQVDPAHAEIAFAVRHMGISTVRGFFERFSGTVEYDGRDLSSLRIQGRIETASVDTRSAKRDKHLRSAEFFEVENYPEITFTTRSISGHTLVGLITIKGVTKEIRLAVDLSGPIDSPFEKGVKIIGLHAEGQLKRHDFGVAPTGPVDKLIGDVVKIEIDLEAKR